MTFSLRTLFLFFPTLIVSYALAYGCAVQADRMSGRTCRGSTWVDQRNNVRMMQFALDHQMPRGKIAAEVQLFNDYLSGKQPLPKKLFQDWYWVHYVTGDFWGNPYRCVARETAADDSSSPTQVTRLHFYSCGQDGVSRSDGNDEDDINSWSDHSQPFYAEVYRRQEARDRQYESLFYLPWTLGAVVAGWLFLRRFYS